MFQKSIPPPKDDPPFERIDDRPLFTRVLVNSGYRLYELVAGEKTFYVWAKPRMLAEQFHLEKPKARGLLAPEPVVVPLRVTVEYEAPNLSAIAFGDVTPAVSREVKATDFILLDEKDGGYIVAGYDRHRE